MTDKQLKKLSRGELLQLLITQTEKNEELTSELEKARKRLESRMIICESAGSIAEASLQINKVFTAAQNAAQQYLENLERMSAESDEEKERMLSEARLQADEIKREAEKYSSDLRKEADEYWSSVYDKAQSLIKEYGELQKLASSIERK